MKLNDWLWPETNEGSQIATQARPTERLRYMAVLTDAPNGVYYVRITDETRRVVLIRDGRLTVSSDEPDANEGQGKFTCNLEPLSTAGKHVLSVRVSAKADPTLWTTCPKYEVDVIPETA